MEESPENMPACQSTATRRTFLKVFIGVLAFLMGLALGIPLVGSLLGSRRQTAHHAWSKVAEVSSLPIGQPVRLNFSARTEDAYQRQTVTHSVWVIKNSQSNITVFSPICPHLGCYFNWDRQSGRFECPCHLSIFSVDGKVLSGPAPRPLDALPVKIEDDVLFTVWERFKVGIPQKLTV
jgi:quinol---cytochrome c reductase iron-sulfur subunit, bacillus type